MQQKQIDPLVSKIKTRGLPKLEKAALTLSHNSDTLPSIVSVKRTTMTVSRAKPILNKYSYTPFLINKIHVHVYMYYIYMYIYILPFM